MPTRDSALLLAHKPSNPPSDVDTPAPAALSLPGVVESAADASPQDAARRQATAATAGTRESSTQHAVRSVEKRFAMAKGIFDDFLMVNARWEINLRHDQRLRVTQAMASLQTRVHTFADNPQSAASDPSLRPEQLDQEIRNVFNEAQTEVLDLLQTTRSIGFARVKRFSSCCKLTQR